MRFSPLRKLGNKEKTEARSRIADAGSRRTEVRCQLYGDCILCTN